MKLPQTKSKEVPVTAIRMYIQEYVGLRESRNKIDARMKEIGEILKSYAAQKGQKDDKGSSYFERDNYVVGNVARKSISFNVDKATQFFRRKGYPECIKTVETIDEEAVEELLSTGEISIEDLENITDTKVSYSISITERESVTDEVQETRFRGKRHA